MSYGDFTYTPVSNVTVIVECWGAGGVGHGGDGDDQGTGGGGGAYARRAGIALTGGTGYLVRVGAPGGIATNHESLFRGIGDPLATWGVNASFHTPGTGGAAASCVGDVKYSGGNGGPWAAGHPQSGTGGGGGAGRLGAGTTGGTPTGGAGADGNDGGLGGTHNGGAASVGTAPGGGGGGGGTYTNPPNIPTTAGDGGEGAVVIWADLGTWPPYGQTPLFTYGTPPANPTAPNVYAFIM